MKTISLKFTWTIMGFLTLILLLTPSLAAAEENDSNQSLEKEPKKATILDVEVNDLLGIENIDIEIPKANIMHNSTTRGTMEDKLVAVNVEDEEIGNIEANVLSQTESPATSKKAVVDLTAEDLVVADDVDIKVLGQEGMSTESAYSSESAVVGVTAEDLVVADDVDIKVLGQEEMLTEAAYSSGSTVLDVTVDDLVVADDVDVKVLGQEEMSTEAAYSSESGVLDVTAKDLVVADDVNVKVLEQEEMSTEAAYSSENAVVDAEFAPSIIAEQIELDVLANKMFMTNEVARIETMFMEEGVHLEILNVPVVGTVHVGVLENQLSTSQGGYKASSSLLNVTTENEYLNSLLGDLELGVLPRSDSMEGGLEQNSSAIASLETTDGLLEDLSVGVLLTRSILSGSTYTSDRGVVELVSDQFPIVDQMHVGVLDRHEMSDMDGQSSNEGVLQLDLFSDPLNYLTVDVLTNDFQTNNDGTSIKQHGVSLGLTNDLVQNTNITILGTEDFVAAQPPTKPNDPEESLENSPEEMEENKGEAPKDTNENENTSVGINTNGNTNTDENIEVTEDTTLNNSTEEDAEITSSATESIKMEVDDDDTSIFGNLNDVAFNRNGMQNASMLPKTGGFFDGMLLMLMAFSLLASGLVIRKFA